jgi:hypothetical protein
MMTQVPETIAAVDFPRCHVAAQPLHAIERGNECAG